MTYFTLWLFSGLLTAVWLNRSTAAEGFVYAKRWHAVTDYASCFVLGPVALVAFAVLWLFRNR